MSAPEEPRINPFSRARGTLIPFDPCRGSWRRPSHLHGEGGPGKSPQLAVWFCLSGHKPLGLVTSRVVLSMRSNI